MAQIDGAALLESQLRSLGIWVGPDGIWEREFRFHDGRKWAFDLANRSARLGVEVDGAVHQRGRHSRGAGMEADNVKLNEAQVAQWHVLRFSTGQVQSGLASQTILRFLANRTSPIPENEKIPDFV